MPVENESNRCSCARKDLTPNAKNANWRHALTFRYLLAISVAKRPVMLAGYFSQTSVGSRTAERQTLRASAKTFPTTQKEAADFGGTCQIRRNAGSVQPPPQSSSSCAGPRGRGSAAYRKEIRPISFHRAGVSILIQIFKSHSRLVAMTRFFHFFYSQYPTVWHELTQITTLKSPRIEAAKVIFRTLWLRFRFGILKFDL